MSEKSTKRTIDDLRKQVEELDDERVLIALDSLFELAKGVYMEEETLSGSIKRYKKEPDRQAAQFIVERALGKTPVALQGTGDKGQILFEVVNFGGKDNCGKK